MNKDFRVSITFPGHPKAVKLNRRLGGDGILALLQLWAFTSTDRPNGILTGMDSEDIEIAAKWNGLPGEFFSTLKELNFVEHRKEVYQIRDWKEHNPWAIKAKERSAKATKAAQARWAKDYEVVLGDATSNAPSIPKSNAKTEGEQCGNSGLADAPILSYPNPSLPTLPTPLKKEIGFDEFWNEYPNKKGKDAAKKAWSKRKFDREMRSKIMESITAQKMSQDWLSEGGKFIPHPASWLNAGRWEDEITQYKDPKVFNVNDYGA